MDWLDQRGCTPGFRGKSAEDIGRVGDRLDTENERVCKRLKRKRVKSGDWEKRERMSARRHFSRGTLPCFCVSRGNKEVADEMFVCWGKKRLRRKSAWSVGTRRVKGESCPREHEHGRLSQKIATMATVLFSTRTILRRKSNGRSSHRSKSRIRSARNDENVPSVPDFVHYILDT